MNKTRKGYFPLLGFCLLVLAALTGCGSVNRDYVESDRATFTALTPHIEARIATLPPERAQSLRDLMDSKRILIEEAEKALGIKWNAEKAAYEESK